MSDIKSQNIPVIAETISELFVRQGAAVDSRDQCVNIMPGIYRKILVFDCDLMLCKFFFDKDAHIPMHNHQHTQAGFVISGKVKLSDKSDRVIECGTGASYHFQSWEWHELIALEESILLECFSPMRRDFLIDSIS